MVREAAAPITQYAPKSPIRCPQVLSVSTARRTEVLCPWSRLRAGSPVHRTSAHYRSPYGAHARGHRDPAEKTEFPVAIGSYADGPGLALHRWLTAW